jgi:putative oxidoreductase
MSTVAASPELLPAGSRGGSWAILLIRWLLAGVFIYMGLSKAMHPDLFLKLVRQYDVTASSLVLNAVAAGLPWFEVLCGLLLAAGVAVRGTALVLVLLLVPFSLLVLRRALAIASLQHLAFCAVRFDCGCGGGEVFICHKLLENALLLLMAAWLVSSRRHPLCARFSLLGTA